MKNNIDIYQLQTLMSDYNLVIRAIPKVVREICDIRHKEKFPDAKIEYLEEYKREMLVNKKIPEHAGEFIVEEVSNTMTTVKFYPKKYYKSLEDIYLDYSSTKEINKEEEREL